MKQDREKIELLVVAAQNGDVAAFDELVAALQDLVVGYAFSILRDWHLSQDAAQEAFIEAHSRLLQLRNPAQFIPWLRHILFKQCNRLTRRKTVPMGDWGEAETAPSPDLTPPQWSEREEQARQIRFEIALLPPAQREAVILFYIGECSHREVAVFLGLPISTVKKRLHDARYNLQRKLLKMLEDDLKQKRPSNTSQFALKVSQFTSNFSGNVTRGESLVRSLLISAETQNDADFAAVIHQIQRDVTGDGKVGLTLSEAMSKHPHFFSAVYIEAIRRGEIEGSLQTVLQELAAR